MSSSSFDLEKAEIQLTSFHLPSIDAKTHPSLKALTLTSDIPPSDYASTLSSGFSIPNDLPPSIDCLTLELFSLGYPAGFLTALAKQLVGVRELRLYSQLIAGVSAETFADAVRFFKILFSPAAAGGGGQGGGEDGGEKMRKATLEVLRMVDVFVPADFFPAVSSVMGENLKVLDVSWTFQFSDASFNSQLPVVPLTTLISPGLLTLSIDITSNPAADAGIAACEGDSINTALIRKLHEVHGLKVLSLAAYALELDEFLDVLEKCCDGIVMGVFTVKLSAVDKASEFKRCILEGLKRLKALREVEVLVSLPPGMEFYKAILENEASTLSSTLFTHDDIRSLAKDLPSLQSVTNNILRRTALGYSSFRKTSIDEWVGQLHFGNAALTEEEKEGIRRKISEEEEEGKIVEVEERGEEEGKDRPAV